MSKYFQVFKISWANGFVYRLNFIMWRVRSLFHLFTVYFLWIAIFGQRQQVFGYSQSVMLTYVLGTAVLRSFVLSSRSVTVGMEIANGNLSNYLIKPINYFANWLSRDLADKLLNIFFVTIEISLFILLFKPSVIPPASLAHLVLFLLATIIAMLMYFFFSFLVSSFTFWYPEHNGWPLRFIIFMVLEFLAGSLFPLDIFPQSVFNIFRLFPPAYFLFYPMQIYLGRLPTDQLGSVFLIMGFWLLILYKITQLVWKKGLKIYGAYGR